MRLVEAVGGEAAQLAEDLFGRRSRSTPRATAFSTKVRPISSISSIERSCVIARRSRSASASLKPATADATSMTCSW